MALILSGDTGVPASGMPAGSVVQVVQAQYASQTANSTDTFADTGLTATITPTSASNKVLVLATINGLEKSNQNTQNAVGLKLVRNSTDLSFYLPWAGWTNAATSLITPSGVVNYLDSPATTSATTYKIQFKNQQNGAAVYVQSSGNISFMVLMEIKV